MANRDHRHISLSTSSLNKRTATQCSVEAANKADRMLVFFFVVKRQTTSIVPCQACFVMIYIYVILFIFFEKNDEAPVCNQNKTIVSGLTFLRSSQRIVGWGGGGRQMDGGTDK